MPLTAPPPAPSTADPSTFSTRMDATLAWLATFVTEASALSAAMNAAAAGGALAIDYDFSTTTTAADPGAGTLRLNHATQNLATEIYLDVLDSNGVDWTSAIDLFDDSTSSVKGFLVLRNASDGTKYLVFALTSMAAPAGYRTAVVSCVASSAASPFTNTDDLTLEFTRTGDKGDTGATGATGSVSLAGNATGGINELKGTDIASAATTMDIWAAAQGNTMTVTGTTATSGLPAAPQAGASRKLIAGGAWPLTHGADFILPGSANYTCTAGDIIEVTALTTTQFRLKIAKADGTPVVSGAAPALVYLSTVTASNSATVDIETTFDGTYDEYVLKIDSLVPDTATASIQCRLKVGGAYDTGSNYGHSSTSTSAATTITNSSSASSIAISPATISNSLPSNFTFNIHNPASITLDKTIDWHGVLHLNSARSVTIVDGAGVNSSTSAMTGIRFYMSSGNITAGKFRLYGIKNS
jgi:hypothetical protein